MCKPIYKLIITVKLKLLLLLANLELRFWSIGVVILLVLGGGGGTPGAAFNGYQGRFATGGGPPPGGPGGFGGHPDFGQAPPVKRERR